MMCGTMGCNRQAKWEIQIANDDLLSFKSYFVCDEHSPDPKDLDPVHDNIKRVDKTEG